MQRLNLKQKLTDHIKDIVTINPHFFSQVKSAHSISLLVLASLLNNQLSNKSLNHENRYLLLLKETMSLCNMLATEIVGSQTDGLIELSKTRIDLHTFEWLTE